MDSRTGIVLFFVWIICAGIGAIIGFAKNRVGTGLLLGGALGLIGVIIIACLPKLSEPVKSFSLARGQTQLGSYPLSAINQMVGTGQFVPTDYYLDVATNTWKPLSALPGVLFPVKSASL